MANSLAKNTFYLTIAAVGQKILAFVYFLLIARIMMPESTGAYFLALSITTIFAVIADFGITPVIIREIAKTPERAKELVQTTLGLKLPLLLTAVIAANVAVPFINQDAEIHLLVLIATAVLALDSFSLLFYGVMRGYQKLQFESLGIFLGQLFTVTFGGIVLFTDPRLDLLIVALIIGSAFNAFYSAKQVIKMHGWNILAPSFDWKPAKKLLAIALPFALATVFVKVYSYIDSIFLSIFLGTAAVGIYSVAYKLTYAFQFIPLAFIGALYPGLSALVGKDDKRLAEMLNGSMWYMAIVGAPITLGIWAIAEDLVLLAGGSYLEAVPVLQMLVLVLIPIFLDFPLGSLLSAADRQKTKTVIIGITMVINVLLNWLLIPKIGVIGAAYAGVGAFSFMLIADLYFVPKIVKGYRYRDLLNMLAPIFASALIMAAVAYYLRPILGFILTIPIAAVVYIALLIALRAVTKDHLKEVQRLLNRKRYATDAPTDN